MDAIDRTRNLVLTEPFDLGSSAQRSLTGSANLPLNSSLAPNRAQMTGIFEPLSELVADREIPGLTHTPPTRAAGDPPGTAQAGTVVFDRSRTYQTGGETEIRLGVRGQGNYLSDEQLRRNLDLGGGTTTGVGQVNLRAAATIGRGSLDAIGQPGNLQPGAGVQFSAQIDNIGGNPVSQGEVRGTFAGTRAAVSAFGRADTNGQRAAGLQGVARPFAGTTLNLDVTATDGPRAGDARLTVRGGVTADLGRGFSVNGYVQHERGGGRETTVAGAGLRANITEQFRVEGNVRRNGDGSVVGDIMARLRIAF